MSKVRPPSPLIPHFRLSEPISQTLYWATPPQRWWRNASLWGVKVGDHRVVGWAVCRRGRLSLLGWDNRGFWMALGAGHAFVFLAKLVYDYRPHEISLGGRLLKTLPKINMSMKGHKQNVTPMLTYNPNDNWPRFLVVEAAIGNPKPLTDRMDVFAWHKAVEGMGGSYKSIKPMNDGRQLLVHFDNKVYSDNLLRADKLIDINVKVTPHRALNSSRCVIGPKELRNMDEEDIKDKLKSQGVTKVERMKRRKDGHLVPSDSYILTINSPNIPPQIKVGFLIRNTKVYIPNPQRCFNCQKYGHNKRFCKNEAKCGQAWHDDHECENEANCANCNGDHPAYVRSCPKWKIEKEIIKVKYQKNIPFHEARQQVEGPVTDPSKTHMLLCQNLINGPVTLKLQTLSKLNENGWLTPLIPYWKGLMLSKLKSQYKINHPPVLPLNYVK